LQGTNVGERVLKHRSETKRSQVERRGCRYLSGEPEDSVGHEFLADGITNLNSE
jgi:hypothetical protein